MKVKDFYYLIFVALVSLGAVLVSLFAQHVWGLRPCILCSYERYAYIAMGILALLALYFPSRLFSLRWGILIVVLIGALISFYHVGIEQHWWVGFSKCNIQPLPSGATMEEIRAHIMNSVRCDEAQFKIFGFTAAFWNMLVFLFLFVTGWRLLGCRCCSCK